MGNMPSQRRSMALLECNKLFPRVAHSCTSPRLDGKTGAAMSLCIQSHIFKFTDPKPRTARSAPCQQLRGFSRMADCVISSGRSAFLEAIEIDDVRSKIKGGPGREFCP